MPIKIVWRFIRGQVMPRRRAKRAQRRAERLKAAEECRALRSELFGTDAVMLKTRVDLLEYMLDYSKRQAPAGLWMEFGVHTAFSLNRMAEVYPGTVYGFDSFEGLPEDWVIGSQDKELRGTFAVDVLPEVRPNVVLEVGLFEDRLPDFLARHPEPAGFVHIDCDLYSSTRTVLRHLRLQPGCILLFDEYYNYPSWREHEYKAFQEFLTERGVRASCIAYAERGWNAAFRIDSIDAACGSAGESRTG